MSVDVGGDGTPDRVCPVCGIPRTKGDNIPDHIRSGRCNGVDDLRARLDERAVGTPGVRG